MNSDKKKFPLLNDKSSLLGIKLIATSSTNQNNSILFSHLEQLTVTYGAKLISALADRVIIKFEGNNGLDHSLKQAARFWKELRTRDSFYKPVLSILASELNWKTNELGALVEIVVAVLNNSEDLSPSETEIYYLESIQQNLGQSNNLHNLPKLNFTKIFPDDFLREKNVEKLYGRDIQLHIIEKYFTSERSKRKALCVYGAPGIGKSTLISYFLKCTYERYVSIKFDEFCSSNALLSVAMGILVNEKINLDETLPEHLEMNFGLSELDSEYLVDFLFNFRTSAWNDLRGWKILSDLIRHLSLVENYYLYFEDIQWAPQGFENYVSKLLLDNEKLCVIACSRKNNAVGKVFDKMFLDEFGYEDAHRYCVDHLPEIACTKENTKYIYNSSGGNVLFFTELVRYYRENVFNIASLQDANACNTLLEIPTLRRLVLLGYEQLSDRCKIILDIASCIGEAFSAQLLASLIEEELPKVQFLSSELVEEKFLSRCSDDKYEFSHSLKRESIYSNISKDRKRNIHSRILKNINKEFVFKNIELAARQAYLAEDWIAAYMLNYRSAIRAVKQMSVTTANTALERCTVCLSKLNKLTTKRDIRIRLLLIKCSFLAGDIKNAQHHIKRIEDKVCSGDLDLVNNSKFQGDQTFYYWVTAEYKKALTLIEYFLSNEIDAGLSATLQLRRVGILSDQGNFNLSNKYAEQLEIKGGDPLYSAQSLFPILPALYSIQARNYSYVGNKISFRKYEEKALQSISGQLPSTYKIFAYCYLADALAHLRETKEAYRLVLMAREIARFTNVNILDSYLASVQGYLEVLNGNSEGIRKISQAIYEAEMSGKIGRLSYYYLLYAKSLEKLGSFRELKRIIKSGHNKSLQSGEDWVRGSFEVLAAAYGVTLKNANREANIIDFKTAKSRSMKNF